VDKRLAHDRFLQRIGDKSRRIIRAKERENITIWAHLGTLGMIGWSVSIPILMGAGIGWFVDNKWVGGHRWTLAFLVLGLLMGCWNASYWVSKQFKEIDGDKKDNNE
jgi:ATP synthase protein I